MNSISHGGKQDGSSKDAASANPANPSPCHAALGCLPDSIVTWFLCLSFSFYPEETWTDDGKICFSPFSETTHVYSTLGKYWLGDLTDEVLGVRPSEKETLISVKWLPPVDGEVISFFTEELVIAKWCWSWSSNTLVTCYEELTDWKRPWRWERLRAGGEGDDRGWDGWMASLTQCNGREFEQAPGDSEGQGSLACCSRKEPETT